MPDPVYGFGEFRLDAERFELRRDDYAVRLEKKPLELLILLVSSGGRLVTRTEIAERLWQREVFVDTEHGINTAIRKIRAALRDDTENPRFVQTVTGMGYRFIADVNTIEASAPQEPVSELPSEPHPFNVAAPEPAPTSISAAPEHGGKRRLWGFMPSGVGVVVLIVVAAAGMRPLAGRLVQGKASRPLRSIAVLPLANYSGNPSQDYLADGMTDELITMLAKDSTLRVTSRTSVLPYKGAKRPIAEIARALDVDGILEGSISQTPQGVHITLQLIRADTDSHVWAESYDRGASAAVTLPDEAAHAIAARLNSAAPGVRPARYVSPQAHDAYLRGHYLWTVGRYQDAKKEFDEAVRLQPDYALGWAGLSEYYGAGAFYGQLDPSALPKCKAAAEKAIELDNSLSEAHEMLAGALFFADWNGPRAVEEITRAVALAPGSAEAIHMHAVYLSGMGRNQEAIAVQKASPDYLGHAAAMAKIFYLAHQFDDALADGRMRLHDFPKAPDLLLCLARIYHAKGMDRESAEMLAQLYAEPNGQPNGKILNAYRVEGYRGVLRWQLAQIERAGRTQYVSPASLAGIEVQLGDREKTFALLEQAFQIHDPALVLLGTDPAYDSLRGDPRFHDLVARIGLVSKSGD